MAGLRLCLLACRLLSVAGTTRILFIGNSFTFVNDLPHKLIHIAAALGEQVEVGNSTIGGCTLYAQCPSRDARTKELLSQEDWDFVVLQDYSALPTVKAARRDYLQPAVSEFVAAKKEAKLVLYMTWGYHEGTPGACPTSDTGSCFPLGTLASLTSPPCASDGQYHNEAGSFECMGYSLARDYLSAMKGAGVDLVVPCGLAWQVVRGSTSIPAACKALVDAKYSQSFPLGLPFKVDGGALDGFMLYRKFPTFIDKHPNVAGQYLNALTFFSALFGKSPLGAPPPLNTGSAAAGDRPLTAPQLKALQTAAHGAAFQCGKQCGLAVGPAAPLVEGQEDPLLSQ